MLLEGRTAVITGAAGRRGIGFATARLFAAQGARVAILDLDEANAAAAAAELGGEGHLGLACDVTDAAACRRAADRVLEAWESVDVLVNNAGITQKRGIMEITADDWGRVIDVNLTGVFNMSQALIPHMRGRGRGAIACTASVAGQRGGGIIGGPHYAASKAGVLGLAKGMARDLGPDGVRVNCVTPSLIETDIIGDSVPDEKRREILAQIPLGRIGRPEDVAGAFLFLASDLSAYVTGAAIDVNGGMLIHG